MNTQYNYPDYPSYGSFDPHPPINASSNQPAPPNYGNVSRPLNQ